MSKELSLVLKSVSNSAFWLFSWRSRVWATTLWGESLKRPCLLLTRILRKSCWFPARMALTASSCSGSLRWLRVSSSWLKEFSSNYRIICIILTKSLEGNQERWLSDQKWTVIILPSLTNKSHHLFKTIPLILSHHYWKSMTPIPENHNSFKYQLIRLIFLFL